MIEVEVEADEEGGRCSTEGLAKSSEEFTHGRKAMNAARMQRNTEREGYSDISRRIPGLGR
jgi:hypothetical protein